MSFVHPLLLIGLALGSVPILIHLLTRRRHKIVRWGAMKYLLAAIEESSRRVQIEDLILLALRVLTVCLLALAVARPFIQGGRAPARPHLAVVLIDNSPSMTARRGGVSRWDLARRWSKDLLRQLPSGSAVAIVPMAGPAGRSVGLTDPTHDLPLAGRVLDELVISARRADPAASLATAAAVVADSDLINRTVYLVGDFQAADWTSSAGPISAAMKNLLAQPGTSVLAVQCSGREIENCALVDLERTLRVIKVDSPAQISATIERHSPPETPRTNALNLTATLHVDGAKTDSRTNPLPANSRRQVVYFASFDKEGCHAVELRSAPDICPADDVRYLAVEAREEVRVLCVDGDPRPGEEWQSETYYLRLALSPEVGALSSVAAKIITPAELAQEDLKNYDLVVLANVGHLDPPRARDLAAYVRSRRALAVFLGDLVEADNYNATLFSGGPDGLFQAHLGSVVEAPAAPATQPDEGGWRVVMESLGGPVMPFFRNPQNDGGFSRGRFTRAFEVDLAAARGAFVHAKLNNGLPLVFGADVGEGRVVVVNTTADLAWSNLPPRPAFIPLIQRMIVWLLEPGARCRNLQPGDKYRLSLPLSAINAPVTIKTPDGSTASCQPLAVNDFAVVEFANTSLAGFYEVTWPAPDTGARERRLFSVNIDPVESDLATVEPEGLRDLAGGAPLGWLDAAATGRAATTPEIPAALGGGDESWRMILLAALAVLTLETYLGRRFSGSSRIVAGGSARTSTAGGHLP